MHLENPQARMPAAATPGPGPLPRLYLCICPHLSCSQPASLPPITASAAAGPPAPSLLALSHLRPCPPPTIVRDTHPGGSASAGPLPGPQAPPSTCLQPVGGSASPVLQGFLRGCAGGGRRGFLGLPAPPPPHRSPFPPRGGPSRPLQWSLPPLPAGFLLSPTPTATSTSTLPPTASLFSPPHYPLPPSPLCWSPGLVPVHLLGPSPLFRLPLSVSPPSGRPGPLSPSPPSPPHSGSVPITLS